MGKADYYQDGGFNFTCDLCGCKNKASDAMRTWNNLYVCRHHKELRNPQDFIRGVKENMSLPWTRTKQPETFSPDAQACTLRGTNSIPSFFVPGCAIPSKINLAFLPSDPMSPSQGHCTLEGLNAIPGFANPGCLIPSYTNLEQLENSALDTVFGKY
jgi:hypothetical protein